MSVFSVVTTFLRFLAWLLEPVLWLIFRDNRRVTQAANPVLRYSIDELTAAYRSKRIKCEAVVQAYIDRIRQVNPDINAVVQERFTEALQEAREADARMETAESTDHLPLLGVPFTVKQTIAVKGVTNQIGSLHRPTGIFSEDSEAVKRLRAAGAIPLLVSNTPEASFGWESFNHITGRTLNPFNFSKSAGGSSGGEGALISSDCSVFGLGTDTAGSIRLPALFNGICGHKGTPEFVPKTSMLPVFKRPEWDKYTVLGPMAKNISDLKLLMKVLTNNATDLELDTPIDITKVKVVYAKQLSQRPMMTEVDEDIQQSIEKVIAHLESKTGGVKGFDTHKFQYLPEVTTARIISSTKFPKFLQTEPAYLDSDAEIDEGPASSFLCEFFLGLFGLSKFTLSLTYFELIRLNNGMLFDDAEKWMKVANKMEAEFLELLSTNTVLILPTYPSAAATHYATFLRPTDGTYLMLANAFGLPATHVPTGFNKAGLPIGLQVIAGPKMDRLTLAVAKEIESFVGK